MDGVGGHESLPSCRHESLPPWRLGVEGSGCNKPLLSTLFVISGSFRHFRNCFQLLFYISGMKKAGSARFLSSLFMMGVQVVSR
jgi:hypothetical protein